MFRFGIFFIISCLSKCTLVLNTDSNTTCLDFYKTKSENINIKSCTGELIVSHCILNEENQEVDVCVQWKWITPGYCPYYDSTSNAIKEVRCSYYCLRRDDLKDICICSSKYAENASCKTTCRDDFKSYDYIFCEQEVLSTVIGFVPTTISTTQESVTYDKDNRAYVNEERGTDLGSAVGIVFGVLIPIILMVAAALLLIKNRKILEYCRKGSKENIDIEGHSHEKENLSENKKEEEKKDENERNIYDSKGNIPPLENESYPTEEDKLLECNEEENKQNVENKRKDNGKKVSHEFGKRELSSLTQGIVGKAENGSAENDENQRNKAGNKDKDVKLHALISRGDSLIPAQVISTTSGRTPKSDLNHEDMNLEDKNKMSDCFTSGSDKERSDSSEHKSDEKDSKNVINAENTGGSVYSIQNNLKNENSVDPSINLTEASVEQDGNLDACKLNSDSIVETDDKEETSSEEEEDTGGVFDDTLDSIKRKDDEEKGGSQELHEFLEEISTRLAKKILYYVLKYHVTDPHRYLNDESKISLVKELLPTEYQASVSIDSNDKKSISVIYAILQLSLDKKHQPKSGWGQVVKDTDTGVGDDAERLYQVHTLCRGIANPEQVSLAGYIRLCKLIFGAVNRLDVKGWCKGDYQEFIKKWGNLQRICGLRII